METGRSAGWRDRARSAAELDRRALDDSLPPQRKTPRARRGRRYDGRGRKGGAGGPITGPPRNLGPDRGALLKKPRQPAAMQGEARRRKSKGAACEQMSMALYAAVFHGSHVLLDLVRRAQGRPTAGQRQSKPKLSTSRQVCEASTTTPNTLRASSKTGRISDPFFCDLETCGRFELPLRQPHSSG